MRKQLDICNGQRFGRLIILGEIEKNQHGARRFNCFCDCGKEKIVTLGHLSNGNTKSCGCLNRDIVISRNWKHGLRKRSSYMTWSRLKGRCFNKSNPKYSFYGGRGITVCNRWLSFDNFYSDMGDKPKDLTIDRINNDGNYEPSNCRWATNKTQANNRRSNIVLEYKGIKKTISEWANAKNINYEKLRTRVKYLKWDIARALNTK